MTVVTERVVRDFHDARPGITSRAFARSGSYERLAALVEPGARVLDLGCGDGHLLRILAARGCNAIGLDLSAGELARAFSGHAIQTDVVQARAQALPFAGGSFDVAVSHLSLMLFVDLDTVVAELARILVPGGRFAAMLGGGPVAEPADAFHDFLAIARFATPVVGRSISEADFRALFASWHTVTWERVEVDLSGSFADVWAFLGASYQLVDADATRERLAARYADHATVPCRVVLWLATATR